MDSNYNLITTVINFLIEQKPLYYRSRQYHKPMTVQRPIPWQAKYNERKKNPPQSSKLMSPSSISSENYQMHFYSMLWFEEDEHMKKLQRKYEMKL